MRGRRDGFARNRSTATETAAKQLLALITATATSSVPETERFIKVGVEALQRCQQEGDVRTVTFIVQQLADVVHQEKPEVCSV